MAMPLSNAHKSRMKSPGKQQVTWLLLTEELPVNTGVTLVVHVLFSVHVERKRKLPASRVGAQFDHQGATDSTWLPKFGRVWDNQRRLHSK